MLRRRLLLAALPLLVAPVARAGDRLVGRGRAKFAAIRRGFPEYGTLGDREFAQELLQRVAKDLAGAGVAAAGVLSHLRGAPAAVRRLLLHGLHDELIRLLLTAVAHFSRTP